MLRARTVAVVGASERRGSVGYQTMRQLQVGGFAGEIFPVNPRYQQLNGLKCVGSLDEVGKGVDLVVLSVSNERLEVEMEKAVANGAGSVAIFASCHGTASDGSQLRDRLRELAGNGGIPICGGNGMGFLNVADSLRICGFHQPEELVSGGVTFLSHSGSLFSAMLHNRRGINFNYVISTGLEINTTMDRYMSWALDSDSTTVVALFLETIRDPAGFISALEKAERIDVPVVALKVGVSARGSRAAVTHSEAIAGDDAVYEALFARHGVHRVATMDEMADTIELFAAGRRATAPGLGAVHDSGGERTLLIDTADRVRVPLPALQEPATTRIASVLDPGLEAANPVDAWGTGRDATEVFAECLLALAGDPGVGVVAFCVDLTKEENPEDAYASALISAASATTKPVCCLANLGASVDPVQAVILRESGVAVLHGTETGLRAIRHLLEHGSPAPKADQGARLTEERDLRRGLGSEIAALSVLAEYGIRVPLALEAVDEESVLAAADQLGYPLVLKTGEGAIHKSDLGGVVLGIASEDELRFEYGRLSRRLGPRVAVAEMAPQGVEIALGLITDPQFGPVVIVSAGGTLIELFEGRVALLPPVSSEEAIRALRRLPIFPLLQGFRGGAPADIDGVVDSIMRFSEMALDSVGKVDAVDVNPLIVTSDGVWAVDATMEPV